VPGWWLRGDCLGNLVGGAGIRDPIPGLGTAQLSSGRSCHQQTYKKSVYWPCGTPTGNKPRAGQSHIMTKITELGLDVCRYEEWLLL